MAVTFTDILKLLNTVAFPVFFCLWLMRGHDRREDRERVRNEELAKMRAELEQIKTIAAQQADLICDMERSVSAVARSDHQEDCNDAT